MIGYIFETLEDLRNNARSSCDEKSGQKNGHYVCPGTTTTCRVSSMPPISDCDHNSGHKSDHFSCTCTENGQNNGHENDPLAELGI